MSDERALVELAAHKADDKKADDIVIVDMHGVSLLADYFLLCSGQTSIKVRAVASHIEEELTKAGYHLYGQEGMADGLWVLLDFGTVIVHVMRDKEREFYNLERLWGQGRQEHWASAVNQ
jgi:ribosome-associated protein